MSDETPITLANEFAEVSVRLVHTRNGSRLEISAPRRGCAIQLCPVELEALATQPKEFWSSLVAYPAAAVPLA